MCHDRGTLIAGALLSLDGTQPYSVSHVYVPFANKDGGWEVAH